MRTITLFDTLQGKEREFIPLSEGKVDIYYCGPTVYNYVHLGNFRPTVTFDLLARVMREVGYEVRLVSNYTDIDDKIIKQAKLEGKSEPMKTAWISLTSLLSIAIRKPANTSQKWLLSSTSWRKKEMPIKAVRTSISA